MTNVCVYGIAMAANVLIAECVCQIFFSYLI